MHLAFLVAEELEIACRENRTEELAERFAKLETATQECVAALDRYIKEDLLDAA